MEIGKLRFSRNVESLGDLESKELRIGNYINILCGNGIDGREYKTYQLTGFDIYKADESECFDLKPIPLTEEWLIKFGFEKEIIDDKFIRKVYYYVDDFEVEFHGKKLVFRVENKNVTNYFAHHTKYVHELQNLYYALTGEELTLKN